MWVLVRSLFAALCALAVLLLSAPTASAGEDEPNTKTSNPRCACQSATVPAQVRAADAVITGTVKTASEEPVAGRPSAALRSYELAVDRIYKGPIAEERVTVVTDPVFGACGGTLSVGQDYVLMLGMGTQLRLERCSGSAPLTQDLIDQVEDVRGAGKSPQPPEPEIVQLAEPASGAPADPPEMGRAVLPGLGLAALAALALLVTRRFTSR